MATTSDDASRHDEVNSEPLPSLVIFGPMCTASS
ncbi:hypothetical protein O3G_MSEX002897 [Manduca sexta]|uniref:Uncharacterized protein n=1 Tax=Manduca sexta TaxID=7130 RepID=A0A921YRI1_MANSE|nr:hypothetical protein O3G_MSEX002897 [Manduca sexta]